MTRHTVWNGLSVEFQTVTVSHTWWVFKPDQCRPPLSNPFPSSLSSLTSPPLMARTFSSCPPLLTPTPLLPRYHGPISAVKTGQDPGKLARELPKGQAVATAATAHCLCPRHSRRLLIGPSYRGIDVRHPPRQITPIPLARWHARCPNGPIDPTAVCSATTFIGRYA